MKNPVYGDVPGAEALFSGLSCGVVDEKRNREFSYCAGNAPVLRACLLRDGDGAGCCDAEWPDDRG